MKYALLLFAAIGSCHCWSQDLEFSSRNTADKLMFDAVSKPDLIKVKQILRTHPKLITSSRNALSILISDMELKRIRKANNHDE